MEEGVMEGAGEVRRGANQTRKHRNAQQINEANSWIWKR